jgi:glutaredoxin
VSEHGRRVEVVLYGAADCSLCEQAKRVVRETAARLPVDLREVDIAGDPELERRYREQIPVVVVDGERSFRLFVPPAAFERAVLAASGRAALPSE